MGAMLAGEERIEEQKQFLDWLKNCIAAEQIDVLLVTGDIFDTYTPPVHAQNAYYQFLAGLILCDTLKAVFITGGNHDSPAFLSAPSQLLSRLNIHVVSALDGQSGPPPDEAGQPVSAGLEGNSSGIFEVHGAEGEAVLIVCAVPFLREKDLRVIGSVDDAADLTEKTRQALAARYAAIFEQAEKRAHNVGAGRKIPIVVTGHLYIAGSVLSDNNSERAREVGRLSAFPAALLPKAGYTALGHLHRAQAAGGNDFCRYSGAPLPMSFSEAPPAVPVRADGESSAGRKIATGSAHTNAHAGRKSVVIVEFDDTPRLRTVEIPEFRRLLRLHGTPEHILNELARIDEEAWVEVQVTCHDGPLLDFWHTLEEIAHKSTYKILIKQDMRESTRRVLEAEAGVDLHAFSPPAVFEQRLNDEHLNEEEAAEYTKMFAEIYSGIVTDSITETAPVPAALPDMHAKSIHHKNAHEAHESKAHESLNKQVFDAQSPELF